jgi:hypothetical protein
MYDHENRNEEVHKRVDEQLSAPTGRNVHVGITLIIVANTTWNPRKPAHDNELKDQNIVKKAAALEWLALSILALRKTTDFIANTHVRQFSTYSLTNHMVTLIHTSRLMVIASVDNDCMLQQWLGEGARTSCFLLLAEQLSQLRKRYCSSALSQ